MKMPLAIFGSILVVTVFAQGTRNPNIAPPEPRGGTAGRFQLVVGTIVNAGDEREPTLFRIDTATGQVWRYQQMRCLINPTGQKPSSILVEGFAVVPENISIAIANTSNLASELNQPPTKFPTPIVTPILGNPIPKPLGNP